MTTCRFISFLLLAMSSLASGCALGELSLTGEERVRYLKSIRSSVQYLEKPGASEEDRLQDWIACGGMKNGSYASDAPGGSTNAVLLEASQRKRAQLDQCMASKGYHRVGKGG